MSETGAERQPGETARGKPEVAQRDSKGQQVRGSDAPQSKMKKNANTKPG